MGFNTGNPVGHQYNLATFNPTGINYANTIAGDTFLDAATNGTYNYVVGHFNNGLYQANRDWTNPTLLFTVPNAVFSYGIAYDAQNTSLWVVDYLTGVIQDLTMTGSVISTFNTGYSAAGTAVGPSGMAYDPVDQTLWMNITQNSFLNQYTTSGTLLQTYNLQVGSGDVYTVDAAAPSVPEPASLGLLGLGVSALLLRRLRTRQRMLLPSLASVSPGRRGPHFAALEGPAVCRSRLSGGTAPAPAKTGPPMERGRPAPP